MQKFLKSLKTTILSDFIELVKHQNLPPRDYTSFGIVGFLFSGRLV
jgi:hypothetical protein